LEVFEAMRKSSEEEVWVQIDGEKGLL